MKKNWYIVIIVMMLIFPKAIYAHEELVSNNDEIDQIKDNETTPIDSNETSQINDDEKDQTNDEPILTGPQEIDGKKYYFDENGIMQIGFISIEEKIYFYSRVNGALKKRMANSK